MNLFKKYIQKADTILIFLILECLALMGFALGGVNLIYFYIGFLLSLLCVPYAIVFTSKKEALQLLYVAVPIFILALLLGFGGCAHTYLNLGGSWLENIGVFFAIIGFFLLGYSARRIKKFRIDIAFLCIGSAIALLVFISTIISLCTYGWFHPVVYKDTPLYYYKGELYSFIKETRWLMGFHVEAVSLRYSGFFQVILLSAFGGLFFINPKQNWKKFLITALIGTTGLFSMISVFNWQVLLFVFPLIIVSGIYFLYNKYSNNANVWKILKKIGFIIMVSLISIFGILLILAFINATGLTSLTTLIENNRFLNKLFNANRVMDDINNVIKASINKQYIFGFNLNNANEYLKLYSIDTGSFEFEIIKDAGLIAAPILLFLLVILVLSFKNYLKHSPDSKFSKSILLSFFVLSFLYSTFFYDCFPYNHFELYCSFYRSLIFYIILFLIGYTFYPLNSKVTPKYEDLSYQKIVYENNNSQSNDTQKDDYYFTEAENSKKDTELFDEGDDIDEIET